VAVDVALTQKPRPLDDAQQAATTCCIVGGGPAGAMLALLLARIGVPVTLLEAHQNFERDFRGNTINPAVLQIMAELGLLQRLLQLRHVKVQRFTVRTGAGEWSFADFTRLNTPFPYIMMLPQAHFLQFIVAEAQRYPNFRLVLGARVRDLIGENNIVRGVRYRDAAGWHELRALLTVGADGRFSRVRQLAGLQTPAAAAPMDVLWFRLPRRADDPETAGMHFRVGGGALLVLMDHFDAWQVGYITAKGSYQRLRSAGLEALRRSVATLAPELADRVEYLQEWWQTSLLSAESSCLPRWYRPGLLLLGDAAHVTSPVGGVGINLALQDAVVAANVLSDGLKTGQGRCQDLGAVQRQRIWPTRLIQGIQALIHLHLIAEALESSTCWSVPPSLRLSLRLPLLRDLPARLIAYGGWPVHLRGTDR